ncbi:MAG TPA: tRNA (N6-isopentenyl adenosine(37)-C2)-methylthiotransferase MiaB [Kofleriaceae bacterium]|nr:tRNA (N6-isopentenyl adenosine(37)-C2)-methylthiotransferase MiaB [Kofleriaceae bacterium]
MWRDSVSDGLVQIGRRAPAAATPVAASSTPADAETSPAEGARVYVETYGCQMNVADSDLLLGILGEAGYRRTDRADEAELLVLNTCAIREKAEERVLARASELAALKRRRPGVVLAVVGCMAEHLKAKVAERAPLVDVVAGPDSYRRFAGIVGARRSGGAGAAPAVVDVKLDRAEVYEGLSGEAGGDGVSGFVTIQRGCDKFCTFCVVPYTRGRERAVAPREVLRQVRAHADAGYREVVLLGQTVNSYRHEEAGFADLLRAVARVEGIERVRFTSPYPVDFTERVIDVVADEPKVCNYVHLPVQSGSDRVLERMRRGYTSGEFRALVARLRERVPGIALSTDILSGFSGEDEDDHAATLALMRELRFDFCFMFSYSEREMTYASRRIPDDVTPEVKKRRLREIVALQETISAEVNAAHVGRRERVLIHSRSKRSADELLGRTDGFKAVILPRGDTRPGDLVDVVIERANLATLFGRLAA